MQTFNNKLWSENTPQNFWLCQPKLPREQWEHAIRKSLPLLEMDFPEDYIDVVLEYTLGEAQFGKDRWSLSPVRRLYYWVKPFLSSQFRYLLRRAHSHRALEGFQLNWPIEPRFVRFQWEILRQLERTASTDTLRYQKIWPGENRFALVLVHDVERPEGLARVGELANLEEEYGFRSCFFFVPEAYSVDAGLLQDLRSRGFEIGIHGLRHDGKLFSSKLIFNRRVDRINQQLKKFGANGFSAPLTHRNPEWMQALEIDYDNSFFDADPFEPLPGGSMGIWPFKIGNFVELPHTMIQDSTLFNVLGEQTSKLWQEKLNFIEHYHGMVLLKTHPDYLQNNNMDIYAEFLEFVKEKSQYWHALPGQVASWWRTRGKKGSGSELVSAAQSLEAVNTKQSSFIP